MIWRLEHGSERKSYRFTILKNNEYITGEYNFRDLFTIDSQKIFDKIKLKDNIESANINKLAADSNISKSVFEGNKLIISNPDRELEKAFNKYAIARIRNDHSSKYRNELNVIKEYIEKYRENLKQGKTIDPELHKAITYIRGETSVINDHQYILNIVNSLNDIKYKELLATDPHILFTYLKAIRKQNKLVTTAIVHKNQSK